MADPTYKDLIKLLNKSESDAEVLATMFREACPHISVGKPARLLETVRRIAGPVQNGRLKGAALTLYLERTWTPRIRNTGPKRGGTMCCFTCSQGGGGRLSVHYFGAGHGKSYNVCIFYFHHC